MKRATIILSTLAAAGSTCGAFADFIGIETEFAGVFAGRNVYRVYAVANQADDVILNVFDHRVLAGSMAGVAHTDSYENPNTGEFTGHWNASYTSASSAATSNRWSDSFVTVSGLTGGNSQTALDPSFVPGTAGPIPNNGGWYTSNPGSPIVVGTAGQQSGNNWRLMIMQVAGNGINYDAQLTLGWKQNTGSSTASFTLNQFYTIPAPGAVALLSIAGLATGMSGRRRRHA